MADSEKTLLPLTEAQRLATMICQSYEHNCSSDETHREHLREIAEGLIAFGVRLPEQPEDASHILLEEIADIIESKKAERTSDVWAASPVSYERGLACLKAKRIVALVKPTIQPKCDYCGSAGLGHEAGCRAPDESGRRENKQAKDGLREHLKRFIEDEYLWDTARDVHAGMIDKVTNEDREIVRLLDRLAEAFGIEIGRDA